MRLQHLALLALFLRERVPVALVRREVHRDIAIDGRDPGRHTRSMHKPWQVIRHVDELKA